MNPAPNALLSPAAHAFLAIFALVFSSFLQAQTSVRGIFTSSSGEPGWSAAGTAYLTSGSLDKPDDGWLRLTDSVSNTQSTVINNTSFNASKGLRVSFQFVIWGGGEQGGDGLSLFLFDSQADMKGAGGAGSLGYCKGQGAWFGLGLDAYGNFATNTPSCDGGPGFSPQALVVRGPTANRNVFVGGASFVGRSLSQNLAKTRPEPKEVQIDLLPKKNGIGFTINVRVKESRTDQFVPALTNLDFPFAAPPKLSLGVAATTGSAKNIHEIRNLTMTALGETAFENSAPPSPTLVTPADTAPVVAPQPVKTAPALSVMATAPTAATVTGNNAVSIDQMFSPPSIRARGKSTLTFTLKPTAAVIGTLQQPALLKLSPYLDFATPLVLDGTCNGTILINASKRTIELGKGITLRPAGCTVSVKITSKKIGRIENTVEAGLLKVENGSNLRASNATLKVRP